MFVSSHPRKRMKELQKKIKSGKLSVREDDPFELFISATNIRYCYYAETHKILGNTYGMCVLQVMSKAIYIWPLNACYCKVFIIEHVFLNYCVKCWPGVFSILSCGKKSYPEEKSRFKMLPFRNNFNICVKNKSYLFMFSTSYVA